MDEQNENIIELTDEEGNIIQIEILDHIEYKENMYIVVIAVDEDADEVGILRCEGESNNHDSYAPVEDEEIENAVYELFKERNKESFDIE